MILHIKIQVLITLTSDNINQRQEQKKQNKQTNKIRKQEKLSSLTYQFHISIFVQEQIFRLMEKE